MLSVAKQGFPPPLATDRPTSGPSRPWGSWIVAGFALFRLLDVVKPWPIGVADRRVHGGLGIMLDDVLAGLLAALGLWAAAGVWGGP